MVTEDCGVGDGFPYQDLLSLPLLMDSLSVLKCVCVVLFLSCPLNAYVDKSIYFGGRGCGVKGR